MSNDSMNRMTARSANLLKIGFSVNAVFSAFNSTSEESEEEEGGGGRGLATDIGCW